jgi:hypothetical protein
VRLRLPPRREAGDAPDAPSRCGAARRADLRPLQGRPLVARRPPRNGSLGAHPRRARSAHGAHPPRPRAPSSSAPGP